MTTNPALAAALSAIGSIDDALDLRTIERASARRRFLLNPNPENGRPSPALDDFVAGDRVRVRGNVRPKYLQGATATVTRVNRSRVVIDFDTPQGRFHRNVTCPPAMLQVLTASDDTTSTDGEGQ